MQGVEPVEELTAEQVEALAGGRTLRQQALQQAPPGRDNERMSRRLATALMQARAPRLHLTGLCCIASTTLRVCLASFSGVVGTRARWRPAHPSACEDGVARMSTGHMSMECLEPCLIGRVWMHILASDCCSPALHVLCWVANGT